MKIANEYKKEGEKKDLEINQMQSMNDNLKKKLEESLKSLESNAQMITWLNK